MTTYRCDTCENRSCQGPLPLSAVLLGNVPMVIMYVLGALVCALLWWPLGIIYLEIGLLSVILFMRLICPYCYHYNTRTCPSGYGMVSVKLAGPGTERDFPSQFKRYIVIVFPGWFFPLIAGILLLIKDHSWLPVVLFILFCLEAFLFFPLLSRFQGCKKCMNRKNCPWGPK